MKAKISYYISHPIQYFSPLFKRMSEELDLHVYYFSDASIKGNMDIGFNRKVKWDIPMLEGYNYSFLKNISGRTSLSNRMLDAVNPGIPATLYKRKPAIVIVNGWTYLSTFITIFSALLLRKKIWLRAENPLNQELMKPKARLGLKRFFLKKILFPMIDKFLYIGEESRKFFEYYGVQGNRLLFTPYAVDNSVFFEYYDAFESKAMLRRELGLPDDKTIILFTGKFIDKKRPMDLVKAFEQLGLENAALVMVGEGILKPGLEQYIKENNISNIYLPGFINQSEIVKYYAAADVFVMCSGMGETWGLSVNEAMCFSLPVIVSATCGCAADLVKKGVNGFTFQEGNIRELSGALKLLGDNKQLRTSYGEASRKIVTGYSNDHIVKNILSAIEQ